MQQSVLAYLARFSGWFPLRGQRGGLAVPLSLLALVVLGSATAHAQLSASAQKQIAEVGALKHHLTPAERKLSFNLLLLSREAHHQLPADLFRLVNKRTLDGNGNAVVEVEGFLTPSLLTSPLMRGADKVNGQVPSSAFAAGRVRTHVSAMQLTDLAAQPDVKSLRDPEGYTTNVGAVTTQGYVTHGVNRVLPLGVNGTGVNVGVLSDSALPAQVSALIATGDLPPDVTVLPGQAGPTAASNEGTAMMEIVHDMAPGAKLFFATADNGQAQMAANIRSLRYDYHCDIIVDDVTYFAEGAFQDGTIAQAVNDVTASGALYVSSAANSGNLTSGTSGTWEGDFVAGSTATGVLDQAGTLHNFGTGAKPVYFDTLTAGSSVISLKWSDPLGAANDDYDLYILDPTGTNLLAASASTQDGTEDPLEIVGGTFVAGDQIVAVLFGGDTRALRVDTNRGQLLYATSGSTFGHNAAATTFTMAATYWNSSHTGPRLFTGGPLNPIETFSSDGLRKIFFEPDGTPITAGNFLFSTQGGTTLQKPDATAADGVVTKTTGFNPFFGTSAAAPHAAGIAALVKSANSALSNTQIRAILTSTTLDIMAPGVDRDSGYGLLMALPAVQAAQAASTATASTVAQP